jgi:AraC family transcriptional regulator
MENLENLDIRFICLPALRVVSFYAFSSSPETQAWGKTVTWAKEHNCWHEAPTIRVFGFNNPDPSVGSPNYGYEYWLTIGPNVQTDTDTGVKEFSGGKYAVLRCEVSGNPWDIIPTAWNELVRWRESSHYKLGNHQCLEEHLTRFDSIDQGFILDLYLPITE